MPHLQKILVDTDVLIDFLRKRPAAQAILQTAATEADMYISVVTLAELLAGMRAAEESATEALVGGFTLVAITEAIARRAGALRARIKKVQLPDCLIAATALEEECVLLTFNTKDYPFPNLRLYEHG